MICYFYQEKKIKLECEFLYSKYGKRSDSQFFAKKNKQGRNADTYHKYFIKKISFPTKDFH